MGTPTSDNGGLQGCGKTKDEAHARRMLVHDLRGPLTGIIGSAELLLQTREPARQRELVSRILMAAETLSDRLDAAYEI